MEKHSTPIDSIPSKIAPAPTPHLFPVDHAPLAYARACPQCGARQWLQGLTYYQCEPCGYRDGPTPQDILHPPTSGPAPDSDPGRASHEPD